MRRKPWLRACGVLCSVGIATVPLVLVVSRLGMMQGEDGMIVASMFLVLAALVFGAGLVCGLIALVLPRAQERPQSR